MTTTEIRLNESRTLQEYHPYLFAADQPADDHSHFEVDDYIGGEVTLYAVQPERVEAAVRAVWREKALSTGSAYAKQRAEQRYCWGGREFDLTPKQAKKLAKALKRAAKRAESRG